MSNDYAHITFVVDKSGSMAAYRNPLINGYNHILREQQELGGKATFSLYTFNSTVEFEQEFEDISQAASLDNISCNGQTALRDAIGNAISRTMVHLVRLPASEKPGKIVIGILTDGMENYSKEYTNDQIVDLIRTYEERYNWQFLFLGANQDAIKTGAQYGISMEKSMTYSTSSSGIVEACKSFSSAVKSYRQNLSREALFTREDKRTQDSSLSSSIRNLNN